MICDSTIQLYFNGNDERWRRMGKECKASGRVASKTFLRPQPELGWDWHPLPIVDCSSSP